MKTFFLQTWKKYLHSCYWSCSSTYAYIWSAGPWNYWIQCRSQIDCLSNAVRWVHKKIPELEGNKTTLIMLLSCMFAQLKIIVEPSSCRRCLNETIVDIHGNSCKRESILPPTLQDSPRQWHRLGTLETLETCGLYRVTSQQRVKGDTIRNSKI